MSEQLALLPEYLTAHLQLSLVALSLGIALSIPLGVWVVGRARLEAAVVGAAGVVQTIPSLALLAVMVPALAWLGVALHAAAGVELRSIGYLPAVIGLTLYSVLPMLRNTVTGIRGVDPAVIEAARAVGMTDRQRLLRVELPLALPVMIAGIRTASVWVVGMATLSTPVGATSLGNYIFSGLQTRNFDAVLVGCIAAAGLALGLDGLIHALERGYSERRRTLRAVALVALGGLYAFVGLSFALERGPGAPRSIAIGSKTFTEQYILSEILRLQIERRTGATVRAVQSLGSTVAFDALREGDLDAYVDYSGTIWATIMKRPDLPEASEALLAEVRDYLETEHGIGLAAVLGFQNTYALGMRASHAAGLGIRAITDLVRYAPELEIAGDYEFFSRPEWVSLRNAYGLSFRQRRSMDSALMYQAVREAQVDVITAFSTDGRIVAYDLALLEDDRGAIPPYDAIVLVSRRLQRERPDVVAALRELEGTIDEPHMQRLNLEVDDAGASPRGVARAFVEGLP